MSEGQRYSAKEAERRWQDEWSKQRIFATDNDDPRPKYYVLEMFPYPSGRIHMGHVRNYTMGDVVARFMRVRGHNVLHPMGWDAFGMPAENAAMQNRVHPKDWTYDNIASMRGQLKLMGLSLDWDREFATCDIDYYSQQQRLFLDFYETGLAYRKNARVNWDRSNRNSRQCATNKSRRWLPHYQPRPCLGSASSSSSPKGIKVFECLLAPAPNLASTPRAGSIISRRHHCTQRSGQQINARFSMRGKMKLSWRADKFHLTMGNVKHHFEAVAFSCRDHQNRPDRRCC